MSIKLSVSNIAWEAKYLEEHLALLRQLGCEGVEIAPSCVWSEPVNASKVDIVEFKKLISKHGLEISAFHALLFTRPDMYLFGDTSVREQAVSYLKKLVHLAGMLSVGVLVYGSPASRKVGNKAYDNCYKIAVEIFRDIGKEAKRNDTFFCIEPLGHSDSDFIQTADEAYKLIEDVGESNFGLHLDAKAMIEMKENFPEVFYRYAPILRHFHVSEPGLAPPGYSGFDHSVIGKALADSNYQRFVSIEMKKGFGDSKEIVREAVKYVRGKYFAGGYS